MTWTSEHFEILQWIVLAIWMLSVTVMLHTIVLSLDRLSDRVSKLHPRPVRDAPRNSKFVVIGSVSPIAVYGSPRR